ncbi:hypothetical protein CKO41_12610 [Thiococcus pfennigii]|nr:hypothetical protein [Thiococcus pfennigii]
MIVSHKYRFIFIKTVKTAGTSIEVFLSQICSSDDIVTPIWPHVGNHRARNYKGIWNPFNEIVNNEEQRIVETFKNLLQRKRFYNHMSASLVKHRLSAKIWDSYFKFCVERNPWDKTLSHYHMISDRSGGIVSFDDYIEKGRFCINLPKYTDPEGRLLVDKVIKYETLMDDLGLIFCKLGVPYNGSLGVNAKSEYRKKKEPYQKLFTRQQRYIVEKAFAKEIEMHGYVFDQ